MYELKTEGSGKIGKNTQTLTTAMHHDNRITIRISPRKLRAIRKIVQAFHDTPAVAALLGLSYEEVRAARDALERLHILIPKAETV